MKIGLLKKIRKRFSWYKSKKGTWVLIDHKKKTANTVDREWLLMKHPTVDPEKIDDDMLFRFMQSMITEPFIDSYLGKVRYNYATRRARKK